VRPPFILNTRIYSCNLIRNDAPFRWRGRYNEDTDLSLRMLKAGWCTVQFNAFLQWKKWTQQLKGGNTAEFYAREGTLAKSQMQVAMHPDVSRLVWKFGRWHHHVDYRRFRKNTLRRRPDAVIPSGVNNYGLTLTRVGHGETMAGRPSKYTPERVKKILDAVALGATFRLACLYAGIDENTFARWRERYGDFGDAVKEAEGRGAIGWLAKIERAANDDNWQAAAWKLERRYPQEYGRKVTEVQGHNGGAIIFEVQAIDYRDGLAEIAPGPIRDRDASGADEGAGDGPALG
jgi:hypothetical protein